MLTIIAAFGILIVFGCTYGMANPAGLLALVGRFADAKGYAFAIGVRVLLGAASILAAPDSLMPVFLYAIGALSLIAAAVLMMVGVSGYRRILDWVSGFQAPMLRLWLIFGLLFGVALIWVTGIVQAT